MEKRKILMTAFFGTSAQSLVERVNGCKTLFLPNDKDRDSELLIRTISEERFDEVICFGQRPLIRNQVHVETTARDQTFSIDTNFDCGRLKRLLEANGIAVKISHNAGTSFCNRLYLNGLNYVFQNNLETKMVFIHIPFAKNITDFDRFCEKILDVFARDFGHKSEKDTNAADVLYH